MSITIKAPAKLNLTLDVCNKRADGYHEMDMINQTVDLYDTVTVEKCGSFVTLDTDMPHTGEDLTVKAAKVFFEHYGITGGAKITLRKSIPELAGLGGGSSDAAAVILALNELYGVNEDKKDLCDVAVKVSADVPFCLYRGTARVRGIGQKVFPLNGMPDCTFLLVRTGSKSSTADMFSKLDSKDYAHCDTDRAQYYLQNNDLQKFCKSADNSFDSLYENSDVKKFLYDRGALLALTTGSGPVMYALFSDEQKAIKCKYELEGKTDFCAICHPIFE